MKTGQVNSREFQEKGSVGSNVIRRVEVWGVDPSYVGSAGNPGIPITLCRDSTGFIYQVLAQSAMGTSAPQPGEIWLINRTLGLWTFMARLTVPSPITQTLKDGVTSYSMQPCNRMVFASVPNNTTVAVTFPNPITGIQDAVYGFRNLSGGGSGYNGIIALIPFGSEAIHGPTSLGAHSGAMYVTDNKDWFCIGESVTRGGHEAGSAAPPPKSGFLPATGSLAATFSGNVGKQNGTGTLAGTFSATATGTHT
jgi:hypothetical protein